MNQPQMPTPRQAVLLVAEKVITGERADSYGDPENNFDAIARLWTEYLGTSITSTEVAGMMILLKLARSRTSPGEIDHYVDMAGYAALMWEVSPRERESS